MVLALYDFDKPNKQPMLKDPDSRDSSVAPKLGAFWQKAEVVQPLINSFRRS